MVTATDVTAPAGAPSTLEAAFDAEDTETSGVTAKLTGTATAPVLAVTEDDGTVTSFTPVGTVLASKNLTWHPASIAEPGQAGKTTFGHDPATGAVTRIVAPLPDGLAGSACPTSGTLAPGCRAMDIACTTVADPGGKQAQLVDATGVSNAAGTAISGAKQTNSYDLWGKQTVSVNELGDSTTTTYDDKARVTSIKDPKGTTTFAYNGSDANGKAERRGVVTRQTVTRTSSDTLVYQAAYDANGAMTTEKLPAGITATHLVDEAGEETGLVYSGQLTDLGTGAVSTGPWIAWSQTNDAAGRVRTDATTFASAIATTAGIDSATDSADPITADQIDFDHRYSYDKAGNLTEAEDLTGLPVAGASASPYTTREYTFTTNGARTSLNEQIRADGTASGTATPGAQQQLTYDTADRPTGGYVYDLFGRQTTLPAAHAPNPGAGNITLGYFDSDLPASVKQGSTTTSFTLDVDDRRLVQTSVTGSETTTTTRHYADGSDNPSWIDVKAPDGTATTTRYTSSVSGDLGASITSDGAASLTLPNIHGDIVTAIPIIAAQKASVAATTILGWSSYTEYGTPIIPTQTRQVGTILGYGWLGSKERSATPETEDLTLMGVRFYNSTTASFTSLDPIKDANVTAYAYPVDPINDSDTTGKLPTSFCNLGKPELVLEKYKTKKDGAVSMKCGNLNFGYHHIEVRHYTDWKNQMGGKGNVMKYMMFATRQALTAPQRVVTQPGNKRCYSTPIKVYKRVNGRTVYVKTFQARVIVSINNKKVISSIPARVTGGC